MLLSPILVLLLTGGVPAQHEAIARVLFTHVRDSAASFDTEQVTAQSPWFDMQYETVFVACGDLSREAKAAGTPAPCSVPGDLLGVQTRQGVRILQPWSERRSGPGGELYSAVDHTCGFEFSIQAIDVHGSEAHVFVSFGYSSYFCMGYYDLVLEEGIWRVKAARVTTIS